MTLVTASGIMMRREMSRCLRYAPELAVVPTQSATVLVALDAMGATPLNSRAGKAMKLPPPATALSAPPRAPAKKRRITTCSPKAPTLSLCQTLVVHCAVVQVLRDGIVPIID